MYACRFAMSGVGLLRLGSSCANLLSTSQYLSPRLHSLVLIEGANVSPSDGAPKGRREPAGLTSVRRARIKRQEFERRP
jgi:hypothetical protein